MRVNNLNFLNEQIKNCSLCTLCKLRNNSVLIENKKSDVLFVSLFYDLNFLNFLKNSSFEDALSFNGVFSYTSLLKCEPKKNALNVFLKNNEISQNLKLCRPFLDYEISFKSPKIIVTFGKEVFFAFAGEQEQAFSALRGGIYRLNGSFILPTFSKEQIAKNPSLENELRIDLSKIKGLL